MIPCPLFQCAPATPGRRPPAPDAGCHLYDVSTGANRTRHTSSIGVIQDGRRRGRERPISCCRASRESYPAPLRTPTDIALEIGPPAGPASDYRWSRRSDVAGPRKAGVRAPEEARARARRRFCNVLRATERYVESTRGIWLTDLGR
jgi:hypothetical protein